MKSATGSRRRIEVEKSGARLFDRRRVIDGVPYIAVPPPETGKSATTMTEMIERQFIFQPPFLESIDADYKIKVLKPRVSIRDG
jgi:hypothetical protein